MAYNKQNFRDGQTLTAAMLNNMEAGIVQNEENLKNIQLTPGPQGPQGEKGEPGTPADLTGYATEAYVDQKIADAQLGSDGEAPDLSGYLTETEADGKYQPKGDYLTEHLQLKTINGESLVGEGDIVIEGSSSSTITVNGKNLITSWTDGYVVSDMGTVVGDPYPLESGACSDFVSVEVGTSYILDARGETTAFAILGFFYDANKKTTTDDKFAKKGATELETNLFKFTAKKPYMRFNKYKDTYGFALIKESDYVKDAPENYVPVDQVIELESESSGTSTVASNVVYYALGDSITAGSYSDSSGKGIVANNADWAYGKQIAKRIGCKFTNLGIPGAALTGGIKNTAANVGADATLVTITGGANDYYTTGSEIGTVDDTGSTTICGALKYMVQTIAAKAPLARIVLMSPFIIKSGEATINTKWSRNYKPKAFNYDELNKAFKDVADYCNVEYIDGTTQGPTNIYNLTAVQKDGVHPTIEYYSTVAAWLESKLF